MKEVWRLVGYDTFEGEYYPLYGEHEDEHNARIAAIERFRMLKETQSSEDSGGQDEFGLQDRIFIQRPDGSKYRFIPIPPEEVINP